MSEKRVFEKGKPYHIISRAIDGREIFGKEEDCYRLVFLMYTATIGSPAPHVRPKDIIKAGRALVKGEEIPSDLIIVEHDPLVYVLSFALVIDHDHLELVPNVKNGIPKYMQKMNGSFGKSFNLKNNRYGSLFIRPYKAVLVETDFQQSALKRYINVVNPLDVCVPGWREKGIKNWEKAFECIKNYPFSSLPDFLGLRHSKILAPEEILERYFGKQLSEDRADYIKFVEDYLKQNLADLTSIFLEEK